MRTILSISSAAIKLFLSYCFIDVTAKNPKVNNKINTNYFHIVNKSLNMTFVVPFLPFLNRENTRKFYICFISIAIYFT